VEFPRDLSLRVRVDAADVDVSGTGGDVDVHAGKGVIRLDVIAGNVNAAVDKGDIVVATPSEGYGALEARSEVGDVKLTVNGGEVRHGRSPGPGNWIEVTGSSRWRIDLRVTVGDVRLAMGR
jgi:Toastrack DUF4097